MGLTWAKMSCLSIPDRAICPGRVGLCLWLSEPHILLSAGILFAFSLIHC